MGHHIDGTELVTKKVTAHRFRKAIIEAWDHRCAYCNCRPDHLTLDHVLPKVKGGTTTRDNLVPSCQRCNGSKGHQDWQHWFRLQPWHGHGREALIYSWVNGSASDG